MRYSIALTEDVKTFLIKAEVGAHIERDLELMNFLIAPDVTLGPLDDVPGFWVNDESPRGVPQLLNSQHWIETLSTVVQLLRPLQHGAKNAASIPENLDILFMKLLLPQAIDQDLAR